jgi:hypothetical protein
MGPSEINKRRQQRLPFVVALGAALVTTGVFIGWIRLGIGGDTPTLYVDDVGTVLAALTAAVLCAGAALRHSGPKRRFWLMLAAATGVWALAEATWTVYELVLHEPVPVPSWADVGYLAGIPLAVGALLYHPALRSGGIRKARAVFDGLVIATALLFLSWTLVLGPLWQSTDLTTLGGVVALAYPFGDVVIVFFIVVAIRRMTGGDRVALLCLLAGLLLMALSDSTYAYLAGVGNYESGDLVDAGWVASYLAIALAAFSSRAQQPVVRRSETSSPSLASLVVPFLPVLVALTVAAVQMKLGGHRLDNVAWLMAVALVVLSLVRQTLLVFDLLAPEADREESMLERIERVALGIATPDTAASKVAPGALARKP